MFYFTVFFTAKLIILRKRPFFHNDLITLGENLKVSVITKYQKEHTEKE